MPCSLLGKNQGSLKGFAIYKNQDWLAGSWDGKIELDTECSHVVPPPVLDIYDPTNINESYVLFW